MQRERTTELLTPLSPPPPGGDAAPAANTRGAPGLWQVLDDPLEWSAFSQPAPHGAGQWQSSLVIGGMWCAACAVSIEDALRATPGVSGAQVSAASGRALVTWSAESARPSDWVRSIEQLGYSVLPANDAQARTLRRTESRKALWRWLVAGLCMMQVMMYAYPAYIAQAGELSAEMEGLLRWASWVLVLPVMLFSCSPFFRTAARELAQGRIGMDLPVALGITITFVVSSAGTFAPQGMFGREVYFDSLTMFVFFLLTGRWLEVKLRDRTAGALEAAINRLPDAIERQGPDGSWDSVSPRRLRPGDTVRILAGQAFPADGVIVSGQTRVDQSLLTGESLPVHRTVGSPVVAGSHNLAAAVQVRVERTAGDTRFAQIVALMQEASATKPRLAALADRLAPSFLVIVLLAAAMACGVWWSRDPAHALMVAVAVLIVTCPCALSIATPAAMLAAAGSLARVGVLVRRLQAFENLASVDSVVFDKTGTLTRDRLDLHLERVRAGVTAQDAVAMAAALASQSLHPVARALVRLAPADGRPSRCVAYGVQEHSGQGLSGTVTCLDDPLPAHPLRLGSAAFCGLAADADDAGTTHLCDGTGWMAAFSHHQTLRADAVATVQALQREGLQVHLLSGDSRTGALHVAARLGLRHVRHGCTPAGKLDYLSDLRARGHRLAMVGDGLNDAPVLAAADASFAFGQAVPLVQSHADFVVPGECLAPIAQTLRLARRTMRIVRQNLAWALAYNLACVPLALLGWLPAWLAGLGMAASSLVVVLNALRLARPLAPLEP